MSDISFHSSVIITENLVQLKRFYTNILQLTIEHDFGNCIIFREAISLWEPGLNHSVKRYFSNKNEQKNNSLEFSFETTDFESVYKKVIESKSELLHDKLEESWGQYTIRFFDPDNNLIEIGESMSTFIKRLYAQGLTPESIHQKTSVALSVINKILNNT